MITLYGTPVSGNDWLAAGRPTIADVAWHALCRALLHGRPPPGRPPGGPRVDRPHPRPAGLHRDGGDVSGDRAEGQEGGRPSRVISS